MLLCGLASVGSVAAQGIVRTAAGETFSGELQRIETKWKLHFATPQGRRVLAAQDLVRWGERREMRHTPMVLLSDGSAIRADVLLLENEQLVVASNLFGRVHLPLTAVRGVIFRLSSDHAIADRLFKNLMHSDTRRDVLFLTNGEQAVGSLLPAAQPTNTEGEPLEVFLLETEEGRVFVPSDRVTAVRFNPIPVREPKAEGLRVAFGFRDGGWLQVAKLKEDGNKTSLFLVAGATLTVASPSLRAELTLLQTTGGRAVYLSDLSPVSYKHIPFFGQTWKFGENRNLFGGRLRVGRTVYDKGISMHSTSRVAYRIPHNAVAFDADLALDATARSGGSVRFRVYLLEEKSAWRVAFESPVVHSHEASLPVHVECNGARALALIVDFAEYGDRQDHADWLNARFILAH